MAVSGAMTARWTRKRSRGSLALMRLMVWIALRLGRWPAWLILHGITGYFLLFSLEGRRASRSYLARVLERPPRLTDVYRHYHTFAITLLDRDGEVVRTGQTPAYAERAEEIPRVAF